MFLKKSFFILQAMLLMAFSVSLIAKEFAIDDLNKEYTSLGWKQPLEIVIDKTDVAANSSIKYLAVYSFETKKNGDYYKVEEISMKVKSIMEKINAADNNFDTDIVRSEVHKNNIDIMESVIVDKRNKFIFKNLDFSGYIYIAILKKEKANPGYEVYKYKAIKVRKRIPNFIHGLFHPSRW